MNDSAGAKLLRATAAEVVLVWSPGERDRHLIACVGLAKAKHGLRHGYEKAREAMIQEIGGANVLSLIAWEEEPGRTRREVAAMVLAASERLEPIPEGEQDTINALLR